MNNGGGGQPKVMNNGGGGQPEVMNNGGGGQPPKYFFIEKGFCTDTGLNMVSKTTCTDLHKRLLGTYLFSNNVCWIQVKNVWKQVCVMNNVMARQPAAEKAESEKAEEEKKAKISEVAVAYLAIGKKGMVKDAIESLIKQIKDKPSKGFLKYWESMFGMNAYPSIPDLQTALQVILKKAGREQEAAQKKAAKD